MSTRTLRAITFVATVLTATTVPGWADKLQIFAIPDSYGTSAAAVDRDGGVAGEYATQSITVGRKGFYRSAAGTIQTFSVANSDTTSVASIDRGEIAGDYWDNYYKVYAGFVRA